MASNSIPHDTINSNIKESLTNTHVSTTMNAGKIATIFSELGAVLEPLSKAVQNAASSIDRFVVDAIKIKNNHPDSPGENAAAGLERSTTNRHDIDPESLISPQRKADK